jgi:hypothetical protein
VKNPRRRLERACSAESFVALRSQRYGVAPLIAPRFDETFASDPNDADFSQAC